MANFTCTVCAVPQPLRGKIEHLVGVFTYEECERIAKLFDVDISKSAINRHKQAGHIKTSTASLTDFVDDVFTRWVRSKPKDWVPTDKEVQALVNMQIRSQSKRKDDKEREGRLARIFGGLAQEQT